MRHFIAPLTAILLVSCGAPEQRSGDDNRTETEAIADEGPGANNASATPDQSMDMSDRVATTLELIPPAFHGTYDEKPENCEQPSQYRLVLSDKQLRFHESVGTVDEVRLESPTSVSVTANYEGEGEKWQSVRRLELADDGDYLVVSGDGTRFVRVRCP